MMFALLIVGIAIILGCIGVFFELEMWKKPERDRLRMTEYTIDSMSPKIDDLSDEALENVRIKHHEDPKKEKGEDMGRKRKIEYHIEIRKARNGKWSQRIVSAVNGQVIYNAQLTGYSSKQACLKTAKSFQQNLKYSDIVFA